MKKRSLVFILCLFIGFTIYAQKRVTGVVYDTQNNPVPGVTIMEKGTTNGVISDVNGNFSIEVASEASVLAFSFVGMESHELAVGTQTNISVTMKDMVSDLDEVVVIGYGVQKKKLVTGATVQVDGEALTKLSSPSTLGALQGQTPGVQLTQNSGEPGEGYKVTIRGLGTVGNSTPLYVIDGVAGADINSLSNSDIESVDILKDAASAAIYGSRAANGVILITTKQGKAGKIQVSYDGYYGIQKIYKKPSLLNAKEYMTIIDEYQFNVTGNRKDWASLMSEDLYDSIQDGSFNGTNWFDEMTNDNAPTQNHSINLTGGSEFSSFSLGFSYTGQDGTLGAPYQANFERYTARINSDHVIYRSGNGLDVIKIGENINFNHRGNNGVGKGNIYWNDIHNAMVSCPLLPAYNEDGSYYTFDQRTADGNIIENNLANPLIPLESERGMNETKNYGLNATAYLEIQPIKNLKFRSQYNFRQSGYTYRSFKTPYSASGNSSSSNYEVTQQSDLGHRYAVENVLSYILPSMGGHNVDVLIGQSFEAVGGGYYTEVNNKIAKEDALSILSGFDYANLTNVSNNTSLVTIKGNPWEENSIASYFGRASWNYNEKYMATATLRADGSSKFAKGNRWGYFPSVSAGWVISSESFMQGTQNWMDYLKFRGSWGQNGNCEIAAFQYLATVAFDTYNVYKFSDEIAAATSVTSPSTGGYADIIPNPDITWETSEQLDLGIDARFMNSRMSLSFDWYQKTTKDWLVRAPALAILGTSPSFINGGDIENKGIEIALEWNDKIGNDFSYGASFNIAHNKNKVTRIANSEGIIHGKTHVLSQGTDEMYRAEVGMPIGYFYGYKTAGVFQNQAQIDSYISEGNATIAGVQPGDLIWVDDNHDGIITSDDRTMIGDPNPDYTIGFGLNCAYKGFDFSVTTYGSLGQQIAKSYRSFVDSYLQNYTTEVFQRWHGEGTSNRYPRLCAGSHPNNQNISDIYIEDGDFLKIQNISVGYDFKKLLPNMPLKQARLYLSVNNLYTFTNYSGLDPEIGYGYDESWVKGIDLGYYPSPRTFLMGVNLKF